MKVIQIRQALLVALILVLALAGQSIAQVRFMPVAVGQMVICTKDGAKTNGIDVQVQPTGGYNTFTDCVRAIVHLE